jgi:hypothetical protein
MKEDGRFRCDLSFSSMEAREIGKYQSRDNPERGKK